MAKNSVFDGENEEVRKFLEALPPPDLDRIDIVEWAKTYVSMANPTKVSNLQNVVVRLVSDEGNKDRELTVIDGALALIGAMIAFAQEVSKDPRESGVLAFIRIARDSMLYHHVDRHLVEIKTIRALMADQTKGLPN